MSCSVDCTPSSQKLWETSCVLITPRVSFSNMFIAYRRQKITIDPTPRPNSYPSTPNLCSLAPGLIPRRIHSTHSSCVITPLTPQSTSPGFTHPSVCQSPTCVGLRFISDDRKRAWSRGKGAPSCESGSLRSSKIPFTACCVSHSPAAPHG